MKNYDAEISALIENYNNLIFKISIDLLQNKEEAENIVQETYISYYKNIDKYINLGYEDKKRILARIAINKCKDILKSKKYQLTTNYDEEKIVRIAIDYKIDECLIKHEKQKQIEKMINELKEPYLSLITQYYIKNLTLDEIAANSNTTKATVKVQLTRGKQYLREKIKERGELYE